MNTSTAPAHHTVLVTGGTGFAGSHLVEALLAHGYRNIHVTSFSGKGDFVSSLLPPSNIHKVDLTSAQETNDLVLKLLPTHIYHLAAYAIVGTSFEYAQKILDHNLRLQLNLLEAVKELTPTARVLVVGSAMEYDFQHKTQQKITEEQQLGPVSPYAVSKVMQDLLGLSYAYSYQLDVVRCRPFNHIGERQTTDFAIPSFAQQIVAIERGKQHEIRVGNLSAVRDFTDVKDVANAYIVLMEKGKKTEVYNIGSGKGYAMREVLDMLCAMSQTKIKVVVDQSKVRPLDVPSVIADSSKIKELGWQPDIPLSESLQRIVNEWRQKP